VLSVALPVLGMAQMYSITATLIQEAGNPLGPMGAWRLDVTANDPNTLDWVACFPPGADYTTAAMAPAMWAPLAGSEEYMGSGSATMMAMCPAVGLTVTWCLLRGQLGSPGSVLAAVGVDAGLSDIQTVLPRLSLDADGNLALSWTSFEPASVQPYELSWFASASSGLTGGLSGTSPVSTIQLRQEDMCGGRAAGQGWFGAYPLQHPPPPPPHVHSHPLVRPVQTWGSSTPR